MSTQMSDVPSTSRTQAQETARKRRLKLGLPVQASGGPGLLAQTRTMAKELVTGVSAQPVGREGLLKLTRQDRYANLKMPPTTRTDVLAKIRAGLPRPQASLSREVMMTKAVVTQATGTKLSEEGVGREGLLEITRGVATDRQVKARELRKKLLMAQGETETRAHVTSFGPVRQTTPGVAAAPPDTWGIFLNKAVRSWYSKEGAKKAVGFVAASALGMTVSTLLYCAYNRYSAGACLKALGEMTLGQLGTGMAFQGATMGGTYAAQFVTARLGSWASKKSERVDALLHTPIPQKYFDRLNERLGVELNTFTAGDVGNFLIAETVKFGMTGFNPYAYAFGKGTSLAISHGKMFFRLIGRIKDELFKDLIISEDEYGEYMWDVDVAATQGENLRENLRQIVIEEMAVIEESFPSEVPAPEAPAPTTSAPVPAPGPKTGRRARPGKEDKADRGRARRVVEAEREARRKADREARRGRPPLEVYRAGDPPPSASATAIPEEVVEAAKTATPAFRAAIRLPTSPMAAAAATEKDMEGMFSRFVSEHKYVVAAGSMALGVLALAYGEPAIVASISAPLAAAMGSGASTIAANKQASQAVFGMITQMGIGKFLDELGVTQAKADRLKRMHASIMKTGDENKLRKFILRMTGKRVYTLGELRRKSAKALKTIATSYNIKVPRGEIAPEELIRVIMQAQAGESAKVQKIFEDLLSGTLTSMATGAVTSGFIGAAGKMEADRLARVAELNHLNDMMMNTLDQQRIEAEIKAMDDMFQSQAEKNRDTAAFTRQREAELNHLNDMVMNTLAQQRIEAEIASLDAKMLETASRNYEERERVDALNAQNDAILAAIAEDQRQLDIIRMDAAFAAEADRRAVAALAEINAKLQTMAAEAATLGTLERIKLIAIQDVQRTLDAGVQIEDPAGMAKGIYDAMVEQFIADTPEAHAAYSEEFAKAAAALGVPDLEPIAPLIPTIDGVEIGIPGVSFAPSAATASLATEGPSVEGPRTEGPQTMGPQTARTFDTPLDEIFEDPEVLKALEEFQITPPLAYMANKLAVGSVAELTVGAIPVVGQIAKSAEAINMGLDVASGITYIKEFADRMYAASEGKDYSKPFYYDYLRNFRIPTLSSVSTITMKEILVRATAAKIVNGDRDSFVENLGRLALWGHLDSTIMTRGSDAAVRYVGEMIYNSIYTTQGPPQG